MGYCQDFEAKNQVFQPLRITTENEISIEKSKFSKICPVEILRLKTNKKSRCLVVIQTQC